MTISLSAKVQKLLKQRMKNGGYATPEDAIVAGLATLDQQESLGAFAPGEWDRLLAVADKQIEAGQLIDGAKALRNRRSRRAARAKKAG